MQIPGLEGRHLARIQARLVLVRVPSAHRQRGQVRVPGQRDVTIEFKNAKNDIIPFFILSYLDL